MIKVTQGSRLQHRRGRPPQGRSNATYPRGPNRPSRSNSARPPGSPGHGAVSSAQGLIILFCRAARSAKRGWERVCQRRFHIVAAVAHFWFVIMWSNAAGDWYRGAYQVPGCGPEFSGQGSYLPLRNGVYRWREAAENIQHARIHGPPTSKMTQVIVRIGIPGIHAAMDACLAVGDSDIVDIIVRWTCSAAVYVVFLFYMMRTMLCSIVSGPSADTGESELVSTSCSASANTTALMIAHYMSILMFSIWMSASMRHADGMHPRRRAAGRAPARISL